MLKHITVIFFSLKDDPYLPDIAGLAYMVNVRLVELPEG